MDKRYSLMKLKYLDVHLPHAYTALWHFKSAEKQMFWLPLRRPTQSAQSLGCIVQGLEKIPATFCWSYIFYRQKSLVPTQQNLISFLNNDLLECGWGPTCMIVIAIPAHRNQNNLSAGSDRMRMFWAFTMCSVVVSDTLPCPFTLTPVHLSPTAFTF